MRSAPALVLLLLAGCASTGRPGASSGPVGTWTGRGNTATAPFSFGSVSFVGDHTFTAEARYGGTTRVQSGAWSTDGDKLHLNAGQARRDYIYKVDRTTLTVTDPKSGHSITLDRLKQ